jgi:hypothetical protein
MRRFTLAVALLVLPALGVHPALTEAQVRGGGAIGGGHAVISAPRPSSFAAPIGRSVSSGGTVYRGAPVGITGTTSGRRTFSTRPAPRAASTLSAFGPSNSLPDFTGAVPGLGFDYVHYAAVHPGLSRRRFPVGRQGFFPFFDAGFLLPYVGGYYAESEDAPYAANQPQEAADAPAPDSNGQRYAPQPASAYDVIVEPQKPSEQYVFVRRDGSVFFAVAYSWSAGNLYYVTQEGLRRSVARETLDLDATQQFNEQRGLSFQTPARS